MNLKFLLLLITSLFIISCVSVTENNEGDTEDPFELATGDISDRSIGDGIIGIRDRDISTSTRGMSDWVAPPRPSDAVQEYPDFMVSNDLVENLNIIQTCNPNLIRTPQANISWVPNSLTPSQMRLDVTHYGSRIGFIPKAFVSLDISRNSRAVFESIHLDNQELLRNSTLPNLNVTWFDVDENEESVRNLIVVEGIESGINYRWRLVGSIDGRVVATPSQMITAKVCVADLKDE
tara:strand:- start:752 stop:1456 length:705 start_codon:yes stop_codon:yes gene_type:complete